MHDYVYLGFNWDEDGRQAVEGVLDWIAWIAGNLLKLSCRFANVGSTSSAGIHG
jgi:hypothetical protein